MAEEKGQRYVLGGSGVIDSWTGESVFTSGYTETLRTVAAERNSGHIEQYKRLETLLSNFIATALETHALPWSIDVLDLGAAVTASDGVKIVSVDDAEAAAYVIRLAKQIELERYPDGRPSTGT